VVAVVVVVVVLALLVVGRAQIAKGSNAQVANGAVLLILASVGGPWALAMLLSLDLW
jgi:hypothetical protein